MPLKALTAGAALSTFLLASCVAIEVKPETFFYTEASTDRQSGPLPAEAEHIVLPYACGVVDAVRWNGDQDPAVVYFGGNDFRIRRHADRLRPGFPAGTAVIMFDYPGRGGTTGDPDPDCFIKASEAVARWMAASHAGPLALHGFSFGGFMASEISRTVPTDLVVLEATAVSAEDWARGTTGVAGSIIPVRMPEALRGYDNARALANSQAHIWVVVGVDDRTAGVARSEVLFQQLQAAGRNVSLSKYPGGHGSAFSTSEARADYAAQLVGQ